MRSEMRNHLTGLLLIICCLSSVSNALSAAHISDPVAGIWRSVGYAEVLVIEDNRFVAYGETASSLIQHSAGSRNGTVLTFDNQSGTAIVTLEGDDLYMWRNEFTFGRRYRRSSEKSLRPTPTTLDPYLNLQVAWEAFNENYPFFELRGINWREQYEKAIAKLKPGMTEDELFTVIADMIASLGNDGHAWLRKSGRAFSGASVNPHPLRGKAQQWNQMIREKYLNNSIERFANNKIATGKLPDGTRYMSLQAVAGFAETEDHAKNIAAFDQSLNKIFGQLAPGEPLVLDIRLNGGGYDDYSLMITGRLTDTPKVAFLKQPRVQRTHQYGTLQVRHVFPASGPHATGMVILLTSGLTYSGAEIFTMATMQFPNVTRVGEPTAGALSDILEFKLPNGWAMGLSNERYFTFDGVCYEDKGIPPHVEAELTLEALEKGIDPGLEAAMKLIAERRKSSAKTGNQD